MQRVARVCQRQLILVCALFFSAALAMLYHYLYYRGVY